MKKPSSRKRASASRGKRSAQPSSDASRETSDAPARRKLEPAFPSSPHRPPKYSLHFNRRTNFLGIFAFSAAYSAKKFVEDILAGEEYKWTKTDELITVDSGLTIKGDGLEDVMEHEYTTQEKSWEIPRPYSDYAHWLRTGEKLKVKPPENFEQPATAEQVISHIAAKRTQSTPRQSRDGLITLAAICSEIKMAPRDARQILRKSKTPKPDSGWAGDAAWAKAIKAKLTQEQRR